MPRPDLPLTPRASNDIPGLEKPSTPSLECSFTLPPPAIRAAGSSASSNASIKSDSSYHPRTPARPVPSRKRTRTSMSQDLKGIAGATEFSLPPPPTRSRKIIQMRPGSAEQKVLAAPNGSEKRKGSTSSKSNANTAAGKKTARKTAHSIIERRRRSKMNEEFETMKEMIPACKGQTMHKLAILQAGIDYLRYLEQCVTDLKAANRSGQAPMLMPSHSQTATPRPRSQASSQSDEDDDDSNDGNANGNSNDNEEEDDDDDDDDEMEGVHNSAGASPAAPFTFIASNLSVQSYASTEVSPAMGPRRQHAFSRSSTNSSLPSPLLSAFRGESLIPPYIHSATTSPAILPDTSRDADHEATAALLMLNSDRRHSKSKRPLGGLSVQDLLSG